MKLTKEQLSDLLCTATYGCAWLECNTLKSEKHLDEGFDSEYLKTRCREDRWADRLLAGGTLICCDYEDCDEDESPKTYKLTIKDFENKLEKAATDKEVCKNFATWWSDGDYDYYDCNNLMQYILFGEIVY